MSTVFDRKTYIPERSVVVSTIARSYVIGLGRTAETMIFPANPDGRIADFSEIWADSHGMYPDEESLTAAHARIVAGVRDGSIRFDGTEEEEAPS